MELNKYQEDAMSVRLPSTKGANRIFYPALKLTGEAGEVSEKVGKVLRDNNGEFTEDIKLELIKELGDVLWYIAAMAEDLGYDLLTVAETNLDKLFSRYERGTLQGEGDNR